MQQNFPPGSEFEAVGFFRRLGAIIYDSLILFAILIFAHLPLQALLGTATITPDDTWHPAYQAYLLGVCFLYFGWCWTHGGQTLGMRTWRICLRSKPTGSGSGPVSWGRSGIRFLCAILSWSVFGAGFLWVIVDRERMSWHDRLSGTELVLIPR
uniref:Uncharacterized membrane protein YckC, RDD family n=1 Tax=Candidatus Kentrum sp. FM TaxID=2126340 RepID=A0A450T2A6_9GAMM|nr:MAG: Uncharacterized membrane protein YckC, RDD family [Candidatus Kentron sp. FM]